MDTFILKLAGTADGGWDGEVDLIDPNKPNTSTAIPVSGAMELLEIMEKAMGGENTGSSYKLLAFDLDGTLLDSGKEIRPSSAEAIKRAAAAGKEIVLCTGRAVSEVRKYYEQLPEVRYVICLSGALVMDVRERKKIYSNAIPADVITEAVRLANLEDSFIQFLGEESIVEKEKGSRIADYTIGQYQTLFDEVAVKVDDIAKWHEANPIPVEKMNVSSRDFTVQKRTLARLSELPVVLVESEGTMLELSPPGVSKAVGLGKLTEYLGITLDETIMVGDANNDLPAMRVAGLSIGMGNSFPDVLKECDVVVADNDHDGCAEAIDKYLLGK